MNQYCCVFYNTRSTMDSNKFERSRRPKKA